MSNENESQSPESVEAAPVAPSPDERFKNFQAEVDRKLSNTNAALEKLVQALQQPKHVPNLEAPKKVSVFDDEEAYARRIEEQVESKIAAKLRAENESLAKNQRIITSLQAEYPEVNDQGSELMQRATQIYKELGDDAVHPIAMKTAVAQAASELGIRPKSKRSASQSGEFSMSSSGSSSSRKGSPRTDGLDQAELDFARKLGRPVDDPKYLERLKAVKKSLKRGED